MKAAALLAAAAVLLPFAAAWGQAFAPGGNTVSLAVTGTTARVQVQTSNNNKAMRLFNSGTAIVFVVCGDVASVAGLTTSMPVAPGTVEVVTCAQQYIAAISSGTATLYITPGSGI
jgi:hypothetical protein